jgi:putative NADH-flavin reductase
MKVTIFGATGDLGRECTQQCLDAGHDVTVLARTPSKLPAELRERVTVVHGDGLVAGAVDRALANGCEGILFAIGVDGLSPEDLCTDVTRQILAAMERHGPMRFVWCGGGANLFDADVIGFGAKFVEWFSATFMGLRHRDKVHQVELLASRSDIPWLGIRPLQMRKGPKRGAYRLGYDPFSGFSKITFADCADAMVRMLEDDTWLHEAPIVQY